MLCDTCQRQQACLPSLLAQQDQRVQQLLRRMKQCDRRIPKQPVLGQLITRYLSRLK